MRSLTPTQDAVRQHRDGDPIGTKETFKNQFLSQQQVVEQLQLSAKKKNSFSLSLSIYLSALHALTPSRTLSFPPSVIFTLSPTLLYLTFLYLTLKLLHTHNLSHSFVVSTCLSFSLSFSLRHSYLRLQQYIFLFFFL